ncbi:serine/threonine-protein kinase [Polyangium sp. 15x6]|uniref:serine/threonine-protein kinase n=1 Tax=Polyangium sp. 15x6 TaxID=3042687 RepID=UPI00249CCF6E|nr:serine/threonine-protein kinase [Polyangium sp. 15x6]MDI3286496.1 serine/threonine-protein kinase [Polyangium sp. 15x6]
MNPGDLIQSRYRLVRMLGSGASGTVWAAKNELIDREVALKILHPDVAADAVSLQRFFNEAKASGRVRSPSIVEILDLGQAEDGSPFLVFELLHGEGLDAWIARERMLDPAMLTDLFVGVVRALDSAHQQGIIHRDLKPANLYAHRAQTGELVLKILDFGISKMLEGNPEHLTLTRTGTVVGSPAYMSPEQAAGRDDIDGRADVWSLGVVMHEALTATLPHEAANYNALMVRIMTRDADPVASRRPDLPPALASLVDDCLRRDRDRRPTAGVLAARLEAALHEMQPMRYGAQGSAHGGMRLPSVPQSMPRPNMPSAPNPHAAPAPMDPMVAPNAASSGSGVLILAAGIGIALGMIALFVLSRFLLH